MWHGRYVGIHTCRYIHVYTIYMCSTHLLTCRPRPWVWQIAQCNKACCNAGMPATAGKCYLKCCTASHSTTVGKYKIHTCLLVDKDTRGLNKSSSSATCGIVALQLQVACSRCVLNLCVTSSGRGFARNDIGKVTITTNCQTDQLWS